MRQFLRTTTKIQCNFTALGKSRQPTNLKYFVTKYKKDNHPPLFFGGIPVTRNDSANHLGCHLDGNL